MDKLVKSALLVAVIVFGTAAVFAQVHTATVLPPTADVDGNAMALSDLTGWEFEVGVIDKQPAGSVCWDALGQVPTGTLDGFDLARAAAEETCWQDSATVSITVPKTVDDLSITEDIPIGQIRMYRVRFKTATHTGAWGPVGMMAGLLGAPAWVPLKTDHITLVPVQ